MGLATSSLQGSASYRDQKISLYFSFSRKTGAGKDQHSSGRRPVIIEPHQSHHLVIASSNNNTGESLLGINSRNVYAIGRLRT